MPRIALAQIDIAFADRERNLTRMIEVLGQAAAKGAKLVVFPEAALTGYCFETLDEARPLAEPIPGPSTKAFQKLARRHAVVVIASLFEKRAPGVHHNTAVVIDADGSILGLYRKMHIPDDPLYYEKFYFTPGDLGFRAWQTRYAKIGVLICWDQWNFSK